MSPSRIRYVTAMQQLLALGAVLAVLVPAATVISLDVVQESPAAGPQGSTGPDGGDGADPALDRLQAAADRRARALRRDRRAGAATSTARVPVEAVDPVVTEVPLAGAAAQTEQPAQPQEQPQQPTEVVSAPQPVTGFGTVGVTWAAGTALPDDAIDVQVRTRTDGTWSGWQVLQHHDDHGADPGSAEAAGERPGTDEALVGHVDDVQVKVATDDAPLPEDLSLAVVDPGATGATTTEAPALEQPATGAAAPAAAPAADEDGLVLRAASTGAAQPTVYSRAQWGADEKIREQSAPSYGVIKGGFVHHTVNANDYTADEVPAIIRSIYAYHVKSRGWRDIGYNFLVDRFGRIWEGRYGGIDRPVIGAHTSGYNDEAFAMSAIGNFDTAQPTTPMLQAYARCSRGSWHLRGLGRGHERRHQRLHLRQQHHGPPRRREDRLPGRQPLRPAARHPQHGRPGPGRHDLRLGVDRARPVLGPGRHAVPRPRGASRLRRARRAAAHRGHDPLRRRGQGLQRLGLGPPRAAHPRRHRRRPHRPARRRARRAHQGPRRQGHRTLRRPQAGQGRSPGSRC